MIGRLASSLLGLAIVAGACSSAPDSPWAADEPVPLPAPTGEDSARDDSDPAPELGPSTDEPSDPTIDGVRTIEQECFAEELRCGVIAVPQTEGSADLVTLEFRVLADGTGPPVVQLLAGSFDEEVDPAAFTDRPVVVIGPRGVYPGEPALSCPEFFQAEQADDIDRLTAECRDRLRLAGVDLDGTTPSRHGVDAGLALRQLGFSDVDVIAPTWRALSLPAMAATIDIRRVVYRDPWFAADRALADPGSLVAAMDAIWARCAEVADCETVGAVDDFLNEMIALDADPLADITDGFSETPRPIDSGRIAAAVISMADRRADLAFLPLLHRALVERDAETVSAFVQSARSTSADVGLLAVRCSLHEADSLSATALPAPLRGDAEEGLELLDGACASWPTEVLPGGDAPRGLTLTTQSMPPAGPDRAAAEASGPVVTEPTVGVVTAACLLGAAAAWFDDERVDDTSCREPLRIASRTAPFSLVESTYEAIDHTIRLVVPDTWTDYGYGTWWRDADPLDPASLDAYVWIADDAAQARADIIADWYLIDPVLSEEDVGGRTWLWATGNDDLDDTYRVAVADIDGVIVAIVLASDPAELDSLTQSVLLPALTETEVG